MIINTSIVIRVIMVKMVSIIKGEILHFIQDDSSPLSFPDSIGESIVLDRPVKPDDDKWGKDDDDIACRPG